jgi:hypothetical protein
MGEKYGNLKYATSPFRIIAAEFDGRGSLAVGAAATTSSRVVSVAVGLEGLQPVADQVRRIREQAGLRSPEALALKRHSNARSRDAGTGARARRVS